MEWKVSMALSIGLSPGRDADYEAGLAELRGQVWYGLVRYGLVNQPTNRPTYHPTRKTGSLATTPPSCVVRFGPVWSGMVRITNLPTDQPTTQPTRHRSPLTRVREEMEASLEVSAQDGITDRG